jgi:hypothetical protein
MPPPPRFDLSDELVPVHMHPAQMPGRVRPFEPLDPLASMDDPAHETDCVPPSGVQPVDAGERVRALLVFTGLFGADAAAAWVTVSDCHGVVYFEGSPAADGSVAVYVNDSRRVDSLRILLETTRLHRQAEVTLSEAVTEYAFLPVPSETARLR